jgi:hypothetical protein
VSCDGQAAQAGLQGHSRLLLHQSLRLLRDKQISGVQRKHGLIPI